MVDIVHHALIGLGGSLALATCGETDAAAGFLLGSILPDLDAGFILLGKARFLRLHQGATHSLLAIPALAGGLALAMALLLDAEPAPLALGAGAGILLHVGLDALNTFGVRPFWPLRTRVAADAFFFVDVVPLCATLLAVALLAGPAGRPAGAAWVSSGWLTFVLAYAAIRRSRTVALRMRFGASHAVPDGIDPLGAHLTWVTPGGVRTAYVSGAYPRLRDDTAWPAPAPETLALCRQSPTFRDLEAALRLYRPVEWSSDGAETLVVSRCLAVRNFGNRYGEMRLRFLDGKLVNEHARL